ncbi:MAG: hypothetical protein MRZ41_01355 [Eubacterium sp.]|nr:hypothetical protein [Eubacterium sp.]
MPATSRKLTKVSARVMPIWESSCPSESSSPAQAAIPEGELKINVLRSPVLAAISQITIIKRSRRICTDSTRLWCCFIFFRYKACSG